MYRLDAPDGPPLDRTRYTAMWIYRDGRWQLATQQFTKIVAHGE